MRSSTYGRTSAVLATIAPLLLFFASAASAQRVTVPSDTEVPLVFDEALSSKTAKVGDTVKLHVAEDVVVTGIRVIKASTPVTGIVQKVSKHKPYGVNAKIQLALNPVRDVFGTTIPLEPSSKGHQLRGSRTDKAALATGAGALVLGPVGLIGGLFIPGKSVNVHPGDHLLASVSSRTVVGR